MPPPHAAPVPASSSSNGEALYLAHRSLIDDVIRFVVRRRGFRDDDREEFAASVRLRLVESDYDMLKQFEGRSSLRTYLTVVIQRLALDFQAARWGKWRPSAAARGGGPAAIRLEQLAVRDDVPLDAALEIVEREFGDVADVPALRRLAPRFPLRVRRSYVGEEVLEAVAAESADTEALLISAEEERRFERVAARLRVLMDALPAQDRLVLQMRFEQGLTVADTARTLRLDQKRLYRTIAGVLAALRDGLEAEGIRSAGAPPSEEVPPAANPARRGRLSGREHARSEQ